MDKEHRADIHAFLVIICAHYLFVAQYTLSWLQLTCIHMDEEHHADFHPFLVIICAHYFFVAQYTLIWLHLSFCASAPAAIASSSTGQCSHFIQTHTLQNRNSTPLHGKVLDKDPVGSKVLERNVCVSTSEIKAEIEQPDHEISWKRISHFIQIYVENIIFYRPATSSRHVQNRNSKMFLRKGYATPSIHQHKKWIHTCAGEYQFFRVKYFTATLLSGRNQHFVSRKYFCALDVPRNNSRVWFSSDIWKFYWTPMMATTWKWTFHGFFSFNLVFITKMSVFCFQVSQPM